MLSAKGKPKAVDYPLVAVLVLARCKRKKIPLRKGGHANGHSVRVNNDIRYPTTTEHLGNVCLQGCLLRIENYVRLRIRRSPSRIIVPVFRFVIDQRSACFKNDLWLLEKTVGGAFCSAYKKEGHGKKYR